MCVCVLMPGSSTFKKFCVATFACVFLFFCFLRVVVLSRGHLLEHAFYSQKLLTVAARSALGKLSLPHYSDFVAFGNWPTDQKL